MTQLVNFRGPVEYKFGKYVGVSKSFQTAIWSKNCKWYSYLPPLGAVVLLFCESV